MLAKFEWAVVQGVLPFVLETWVLSESMSKTLEGVHLGFSRKVTVDKARQ